VFRLNSQVTWMEAALEAAIAEQRSESKPAWSDLAPNEILGD
jgi:hypothetical protein